MSALLAATATPAVDYGTAALLAAFAAFVFKVLSREQGGFERMAKNYRADLEAARARVTELESRLAVSEAERLRALQHQFEADSRVVALERELRRHGVEPGSVGS